MAFRLGYQISCNLNNNILIRSASIGSPQRLRSLSPSCLYRQLRDNVIPHVNLPGIFHHQSRRLRLSSEDFRISSMSKTMQKYPTYRNFSRIAPEDEEESTEVVVSETNSTTTNKPYFNIVKMRKGSANHKLQPKNISPMATVNINLNSFAPLEVKNTYSEKFHVLKRQAQARYSKAVKGSPRKEEDTSYRYKLEAANPKPFNFGEVDVRKKIQHEVLTAIPQLQPKNIKPFGNITNIQWRASNIERVKQEYVVRPTRDKGASELKKGDSNRDISKNLSSVQQREYCTTQNSSDTTEKEYKASSYDNAQREYFSAPVNPEFLDSNDLKADESPQTKEYKKPNCRYMLYMLEGSIYSKRIPEETNSPTDKNYFKPLNESTIFRGSKTYSPPITVKIGPKWKLQSTGGPDVVERVEELNPGVNEKFVIPWPSYAERIKTSKTLRLRKPLASFAITNETSLVLKDKYDAMFNKIQSDTNALFLKPHLLPDLGQSIKQSISVLSREYSTGLRRNESSKEQVGVFKIRKPFAYSDVLSKISDIQEKRHAGYKSLSMKLLPKKTTEEKKLLQLSGSRGPQTMPNVLLKKNPVFHPPPIVHHVGKTLNVKFNNETFEPARKKLKSQFGNQPYTGYLFSRQRTSDVASTMMFSTLTSVQEGRQNIPFMRIEETCCPLGVDESLRVLGSNLLPLRVPDSPQVRAAILDEGSLKSKQNLNSPCKFNRCLSEESKANRSNVLAVIWDKIAEYFSLLSGPKEPRVCLQCDSEMSGGSFRRGLLGSNFLSTGGKCFANGTRTTSGVSMVPFRNYSESKFEARRKRKREPCPCVRRRLLNMTQPAMKRLPKHPHIDRPPYKCEVPCVDLRTFRADTLAGEPKRKPLPKLEFDDCPCPPNPKPDTSPPKLKRFPKIQYEDVVRYCPEYVECEDAEKYRADVNLKDEQKTLPVLVPGKLKTMHLETPRKSVELKRLPKAPFEDRPPYICETPCEDLRLFRADFKEHVTVEPKTLPKLEVGDCPCPVHKKTDVPQPNFKRLPKPPPEDSAWECREVDECEESEKHRADRDVDFYKKKTLPVLVPGTCPPEDDLDFCPPESKGKAKPSIFNNNNRKFSTMTGHLETVRGRRFFSTNSHKDDKPKECKKLGRLVKGNKKCKQLVLIKCEPAKDITCKDKFKARKPCQKTHSPYPAFSECKDEDVSPHLTECDVTQKHLQPKWPIMQEEIHFQVPPPRHGKIDPSKEEICVLRKLNMTRDGTKTCENFYEPEQTFNAKTMLAKHKEEEDDDDGEECDVTSEYIPTPEPNPQEEIAPPKEDVCVKRAKFNSSDLCGINIKPDIPNEEPAKPGKEAPKPVTALPKHEKPRQASVKTIKSPKQDPPKLTPKDICDLTNKKLALKSQKKSSALGYHEEGKSKPKKISIVSKKKIPVKVCSPPRGFFQRMLELFFGKPSQPKSSLADKPKKNVSSTSKLCMKGTHAKTKPVFCYKEAAPAAKKKHKKKDVRKTSKSNAKSVKKSAPKVTKAAVCPDDIKTPKNSKGSAEAKVLDVTKAALCADERGKEKSKEQKMKVENSSEKEVKKTSHKIAKLTQVLLCPDELKKSKKEAPKSSEIPNKPKHKIAGITKVVLCPDEIEGEGLEAKEQGEERKEWCKGGATKKKAGSGRCNHRLPPYGNCPPKAREDCESDICRPPCKAKEPPYSSFSECHKNFPKLPIDECREQERRYIEQEIKLKSLSEEQKKYDSS